MLISRQIRLYPSKRDRKTLLQWFHTARRTYNLALESVQQGKFSPTDFERLRWRWVTSQQLSEKQRWMEDTPSKIRAGAIRDLCDAYETNFLKRKQNPEHTFTVSFRSRKDDQSISLQKDAFRSLNSTKAALFFPTLLKDHMRTSPTISLEEASKHDCRLCLTRTGKIFLCVPTEVAVTTAGGEAVAAIDPGVRTFLTGYSPTHGVFEIGGGDIGRITRLCCSLDALISIRDGTTGYQKRRRLLRPIRRLRERLKNLVKDCHHRSVSFILDNFQTVIISPFESSNMVTRRGRKISRKTVRQLLSWSHIPFGDRLIAKAAILGRNIIVNGEEYTTKTCCKCGSINENVGGKKTFACPTCNFNIGRDVNGAINALTKYLTERGWKPSDALPPTAPTRHPALSVNTSA